MSEDPYVILGVPRDASEEQIRSAYRGLVRRLHPDASGSHETAEAFRKVTEAYDVLRGQAGGGQGVAIPIRRSATPRQASAEPLGRRPAGRRAARVRPEPLGRRPSPAAAEPLLRAAPEVAPLRRSAASWGPARGARSLLWELQPLLWILGGDYPDDW
jgi:hypothetical protein